MCHPLSLAQMRAVQPFCRTTHKPGRISNPVHVLYRLSYCQHRHIGATGGMKPLMIGMVTGIVWAQHRHPCCSNPPTSSLAFMSAPFDNAERTALKRPFKLAQIKSWLRTS